jgi:aminoglycoside N3'-acetyltransferase
MSGVVWPVSAIVSDLRALGLAGGELVMVHASLRRIGPVERGADGVLDAIGNVLGAEGTMLMVLGALDEHAWVNTRPEAEREALLSEAQPFDAHATPAAPDVGVLAEVFRQRSGTVVSDHPEGRFAAAGPLAHELLDEVPWHDYFGPGSPLERVAAGGKVLRLGADRNTVTLLHHAEYRCVVAPKRRVRRHRLVRTTDGGSAIRLVECLDDETGIVDYPGEDYFADLLDDYLATGRARSGTVGGAVAELLDAADLMAFGVRWMDEHLSGSPPPFSLARLQARLDAELLAARKRGQSPEVAAIRTLKSALANAEAVPVEPGPYRVVEGSAEAPRRTLGREEVVAITETELDERRRAIGRYREHGRSIEALEVELATLERVRRTI